MDVGFVTILINITPAPTRPCYDLMAVIVLAVPGCGRSLLS
jgi:hypothetical protein